jgi:hypothetical protein
VRRRFWAAALFATALALASACRLSLLPKVAQKGASGEQDIRVQRASVQYVYSPQAGTLSLLEKGQLAREFRIEVLHGTEPVPYVRAAAPERNAAGDSFTLPIVAQGEALELALVFTDLSVEVKLGAAADLGYRLRLETVQPADAWPVLVFPNTDLSEPGSTGVAPLLVVESDKLLLAFSSPKPLTISRTAVLPEDTQERWQFQTEVQSSAAPAALRIHTGEGDGAFWSSVYDQPQARAERGLIRVRGAISGVAKTALVSGLGEDGRMLVRVKTAPDGRFDTLAPASAQTWVASLGEALSSDAVHLTELKPQPNPVEPQIPLYPLTLDVSPGGVLHVKVVDGDTNLPLTSRVMVRGIAGTVDPNFGPDFRASGAGPLADAMRGGFSTSLPVGKYRVLATHGMEYSIDSKEIEVRSGADLSVTLAVRRVIALPGLVGCDLHVHARPSFDSPVAPEDRVLSLVAAGVHFAVPTEHNIVGSYASALRATGLTLASVPGIEVTTFAPRFGHFGVFPYPLDEKVPPYRGTTPAGVFAAVRKDNDPFRILQVNHPRMGKKIGYFEEIHYMPTIGARDTRGRLDFDALEVINGYEMNDTKLPERVLSDWFAMLGHGRRPVATGNSDSHRILYNWAGYPRTYVQVSPEDAGPATPGNTLPVNVPHLLAALKSGHATVSAGPIVDVRSVGSDPSKAAGPGDTLESAANEVTIHAKVLAAPWVDVRRLDVVVKGRVHKTILLPAQALRVGPELGSSAELALRSTRFDADLTIPFEGPESWVVLIARGDTPLESYLFATPIRPIAFTNPIFLTRSGVWGANAPKEPGVQKLPPAAAPP